MRGTGPVAAAPARAMRLLLCWVPVVTVSGAAPGKVRNQIIGEIKTLHVNFPGCPGTGQ